MANRKITECTELATGPAANDVLAIVDVSDTTDAASGTTKKITPDNLTKGLSAMVGDSGSGGAKGLVPAPGAGDAAAGKFLKADGTFAVPSGTGAETGANSDITSMDGVTGAIQYPTQIDFTEGAAPGTPAAGKVSLYAKADGLLYSKDDAATETLVSGGAGGGAGYSTVQDEGTSVTQRSILNFTGAGVTVTDDGSSKTTVNIPTAGGVLADPLGLIMQHQASTSAGNNTTFGAAVPGSEGSTGNGSDADGPSVSWTSATSLNADAGIIGSFDKVQLRHGPSFFAKIKTGSTVTELRTWIGLFSADPMASDTPSVHYVGFRFSTVAGDTNWKCVTDNASGSPTVTDSGVAHAATTLFRLRIDASDPTSVKFYIDGSLVATHTTTLPTSSQNIGWHCQVRNTGSTNAKRIDINRVVITAP